MTDVSSLIAWAKANAKPDANIAEFEDAVSKFAIPDSQPEALEFIKRTPSLRSAFDASLNREYDRAIEKYKTEKLPETEKELRDRIYKELHPEETPEQKRIRELEEKLGAKEAFEKRKMLESALMEKGKEFGIDPTIAADYAAYGEQAETIMKKHAEYLKSQIDGVKNEMTKTAYGNKPPVVGSGGLKTVKDMTPDEAMAYAKLGPSQYAEVMAHLKKPAK